MKSKCLGICFTLIVLTLFNCSLVNEDVAPQGSGSITGATVIPTTIGVKRSAAIGFTQSDAPAELYLYKTNDLTTPVQTTQIQADGTFEFKNIAYGTYDIQAYNQRLGTLIKNISVTSTVPVHNIDSLCFAPVVLTPIILNGKSLDSLYYYHTKLQKSTSGYYTFPYLDFVKKSEATDQYITAFADSNGVKSRYEYYAKSKESVIILVEEEMLSSTNDTSNFDHLDNGFFMFTSYPPKGGCTSEETGSTEYIQITDSTVYIEKCKNSFLPYENIFIFVHGRDSLLTYYDINPVWFYFDINAVWYLDTTIAQTLYYKSSLLHAGSWLTVTVDSSFRAAVAEINIVSAHGDISNLEGSLQYDTKSPISKFKEIDDAQYSIAGDTIGYDYTRLDSVFYNYQKESSKDTSESHVIYPIYPVDDDFVYFSFPTVRNINFGDNYNFRIDVISSVTYDDSISHVIVKSLSVANFDSNSNQFEFAIAKSDLAGLSNRLIPSLYLFSEGDTINGNQRWLQSTSSDNVEEYYISYFFDNRPFKKYRFSESSLYFNQNIENKYIGIRRLINNRYVYGWIKVSVINYDELRIQGCAFR